MTEGGTLTQGRPGQAFMRKVQKLEPLDRVADAAALRSLAQELREG